MKSLSLYSILFCQSVLIMNDMYAQAAISVGPSIVRFNAAPGKAELKTIAIKNNLNNINNSNHSNSY